ncbi:MAG: rhodanese-like domain-containing protein [Myxococcota bacterium]
MDRTMEMVHRADIQFLDTRSEADYLTGHLPGARHLDAGWLRTEVDGIPKQALLRSDADQRFTEVGLDASLPVVVYGAQNDTATARAFWSLAFFGADAGLRLLDGGVDAWTRAGGALETRSPTNLANEWGGSASREQLQVDKDWILERLDDPDLLLVDVRSNDEYQAGHIPGAIHVEWTENLDADGLFHPSDTVLAIHGDPSASTVVVYCQSGARASVSWALLTFAGLDDVRLYDGSWNEWGTDPDTPKMLGEEP